MGVRRFEDLDAWQLSVELKRRMYEVIARPPVARDVDFCDQVRRAVSGAPAHIAEGFGRYTLPDFLQYLRFALSTLHETRNWIVDGRDRGHIDPAELNDLLATCSLATAAVTALATSLRRLLDAQRRGFRTRRSSR